jgi:Uma2 family endonuclease
MLSVRMVRPRVSYADLERTPEDGHRYELYDGEVSVVPAPLPAHQLAVHRCADVLREYGAARGGLVLLSPIDIVFSEFDVVQPDVVFFEHARDHLVDMWKPIRAVPDLAVEVLSPSTAAMDRGKKMQMLARYGVHEYWIVDPRARTVEVYRLNGGAYVLMHSLAEAGVLQSAILPGLSFPVRALFER